MNARLAGWALRIIAAAGLIIDAIVHLDIASTQPPSPSGQIDQSTLFRIEGIVAIVIALAILAIDSIWTSLLAAIVAGSAFGAVMFSVYVDLGSIGPIPDLYEPFWYTSKTSTAIAEGVAFVASVAVGLIQLRRLRARRSEHRPMPGPTGGAHARTN